MGLTRKRHYDRYTLELKIFLYFVAILILGCNVKRSKYDINLFCKGLIEFRNGNPLEDIGDGTFEECLESRAVVIAKNTKNEALFSGKVLSVHFVGENMKALIYVEKYVSSKNICGREKLISIEDIFDQSFYTADEKEYLKFTTLKGC